LAQHLPDGAIVSLEGTLGAGKSLLVRGIAEGLGVAAGEVTSPTFTLWQTYEGRRTLHHLDAYRLTSTAEFWDLGVEELFAQEGLILIEWGDKIRDALPPDHFCLVVDIVDHNTRQFACSGSPAGMQQLLAACPWVPLEDPRRV
jgi:tRNA threonylcarbamoyladenosine biosynthesis protein TsaE